MKRLISAVLVASMLAACSPTWWQDFKSNPVAYVTRFEQQVENFLSTAATIFNLIKPFIPMDKQAQVETDYNKAVFAVRHTMQALDDAIQAAAEAQTASPDLSKFINDIIDAVDQLHAIIDEFRTGGKRVAAIPQVQAHPNEFVDLNAMQAAIHRYKR